MRLQLHALAYNLAVFLANVGLPEPMAEWSLTSLQLKLIKIGARVVRHARAITFQLAEVAVSWPIDRRTLRSRRPHDVQDRLFTELARYRSPDLVAVLIIRLQTVLRPPLRF